MVRRNQMGKSSKRSSGGPIKVIADYTTTPLGTWTVSIMVGGSEEGRAGGTALDEAFHQALDVFDHISRQYGGRPCMTVHRLNGSEQAFAHLAEEHQLRLPEGRGVSATLWNGG
jgi:hypothetical protein